MVLCQGEKSCPRIPDLLTLVLQVWQIQKKQACFLYKLPILARRNRFLLPLEVKPLRSHGSNQGVSNKVKVSE